MVVRGQDRLDEEVHRVLVKVGRDIADPQPPFARAVVFMRRRATRERFRVPLRPLNVLFEQLSGIVTADEIKRVQ